MTGSFGDFQPNRIQGHQPLTQICETFCTSSSNLFVRRGRRIEFLKAGSVFRHRPNEKTIETARVMSIYADGTGIPHIRYEVEIDRLHRDRHCEGPRVLNLRSFMERFGERVVG